MEDDLADPNRAPARAAAVLKPRRPSNVWLIIVAALFIIVPFLTWYSTWFGRALTDDDIAKYLSDESKPRHIQHALAQIEQRIERGDQTVKKFYPRIVELTRSPTGEVRKTTAWVMGQDNTSDEFHRALAGLLTDAEPLVRRNAALQLVRFNDGAGRAELRAMLGAFEARSPIAGTLVSLLPQGSKIRAGSLLGRIRNVSGSVEEFRAPVDGTIAPPAIAKEGDQLTAGQPVVWLAPDRGSMGDALQALAYVGAKEDLALIQQCAQADGSTEITNQAAMTVKAIESRTSTAR